MGDSLAAVVLAAGSGTRLAPLTWVRAKALCPVGGRPLVDSALDHRGTFVPIDATVQGESYFDPRGPLSKVWRDGDSIWSLVAEDRLNLALSRIRKLDERGELEAYVARNDALRTHIGQVTVVFASRG